MPAELARFIAPKGSVALDGVSLTVNEVKGDTFSVLIIPHTLKVTTFGALEVGARLNIEVDQMARYAARLLEASQPRMKACLFALSSLATTASKWSKQWPGRGEASVSKVAAKVRAFSSSRRASTMHR